MADDSAQPSVSRTALLAGSVGGLLHAAVAALLWTHFGFDDLLELLTIKPLLGTYVLLGMFLLGFVPVRFYVDQRVVSAGFVVGGLLILSALGSWLGGPVEAPSATPSPFGFYVLGWVGVVALAWLTARVERRRRRGAIE